jgi:LPXTG-motif cell wall-anchored protein
MKYKLAVTAVMVFAVMALMAPALANHSYQEHRPKEQPEVVQRAPEAPRAPGVGGAGEVLPVTGADLTLFAAAGALTVAVGAALVKRSRARVTRS